MAALQSRTLDRDAHAEIVAYLMRQNPAAHRVLFNPTLYLFDDRDHIRGVEIDLFASHLRVQFNSQTDWSAAMELIRRLLSLDAEACLMSIGTRIDGIDYYGEYAGIDRSNLEQLVREHEARMR